MNPIATDAFSIMEQHLTEVTAELFDAYGMKIETQQREASGMLRTDEHSVVAFIGYAADSVRGSLVLVAPKDSVEKWLAAALGDNSDAADVCDTLGEFANMLLGRLKGRLLPEGFPILLSTPTTASGTGLRVSKPTHPCSVFSFMGPDWKLDVRIDATFEENFALQAREQRTVAVEAGEMMLF